MRILILAEFFYPPVIGGTERIVRDLSVELAARGHDVSVATFWHKGFPEFEIDQGVRIYRIRGTMQRMGMLFSDSDHRSSPPFPDPEVMYALRRIIMRERPDIVHANGWIAHSFTPLKTWSRAKFVVTLHNYALVCAQVRLMNHGEHCTGPGLMKCLNCTADYYGIVKGPPSALANRFWGERERRAVDMFLPVSQAVAEGTQLAKHKVPYRIIPNFIPNNTDIANDDVNPFLARLPKEDFLLFVGEVVPEKGVDVLLQAYTEMNTQVPLVLIGQPQRTGPSKRLLPNVLLLGHNATYRSLKTYSPERLPPNVLFMGGWPHDAVMGAWSRCSIALVPSTWSEPFGIVAIEAMMMGKPVIASRVGGLSDIVVDGETGYLVPSGNPQELRKAIQDLLDNPMRRERMGNMAKQRIAEFFQAKVVVSRIEQIYHDLLASSESTDMQSTIHAGSR